MVYSALCFLQPDSVEEIEVLKNPQILNNIRGRKYSFSSFAGRLSSESFYADDLL